LNLLYQKKAKIQRVFNLKQRIKATIEILTLSGILNNEQRKLPIQELGKKYRIYENGHIKHGKIKKDNYYLKLPIFFRNCPQSRLGRGSYINS